MFAMEVIEELDSWPEQSSHMRKWVTIDTCMFPVLPHCSELSLGYRLIQLGTQKTNLEFSLYRSRSIGECYGRMQSVPISLDA